MQKSIPLALACGLLCALVPTTTFAAKVDEQVVGPLADNAKYSVSLHGVHLGTSASKGSRFTVIVDGVAGPKFDEILQPTFAWVDPRPYANAALMPQVAVVTFSKDGSRYAYLARLGQEWVVMVDGKESIRLPIQNGSNIEMEFTGENGKHFLFGRGVYEGYELWVDGQKWPGYYANGGGGSEGTVDPIISPDGEHIAYVAKIGRDKQALIVDGKDAGYFGTRLHYTADSQHLICLSDSPKGQAVLVNGKAIFTARQVVQVYVPPIGNRLIIALTHFSKDGASAQGAFLLVDGKPVEATLSPEIERVIFSPDGKHYAAICGAAPNKFVVIDGKKGQEYFNVNGTDVSTLMQGIAYSADSSKVGYLATAAGTTQQFVVINEEESDTALGNPWFVFSPDGKHVAYGGMVGQSGDKCFLSIDGKPQPLEPGWIVGSFTFSPDSSRYAYLEVSHGNHGVFLDGKATGLSGKFAFSPNSKHFVVWGGRPNEQGLFVDGQHVWGDYDHMNLRYYAFTNDDEHIFWSTTEPGIGPDAAAKGIWDAVAYLDGKQVSRSDRFDTGLFAMAAYPAGNVQFAKPPSAWNVGADGVLTFLAPSGDSVKRYTITADGGTSVTTMIAEAAEAPKKAAAAAAAAKKDAADKAAAAKAKADADAAAAAAKAKADYDAAVAKRVADYNAAVAKQKADYAAAVAKRKADYDAAVAAQKLKQQQQGH